MSNDFETSIASKSSVIWHRDGVTMWQQFHVFSHPIGPRAGLCAPKVPAELQLLLGSIFRQGSFVQQDQNKVWDDVINFRLIWVGVYCPLFKSPFCLAMPYTQF